MIFRCSLDLRRPVCREQTGQELQAIHARHLHIEQHEVDRVIGDEAECLLTI